MKIKSAASQAGLTVRAVRVYIEEGLISPETYEVNGRNYVEFSDADVERLRLIASLRNAMLSIPQIRTILIEPDKTADVFLSYREELRRDYGELSELISRVDSIEPNQITSPEELLDALGGIEEVEVAKLDVPYTARPGSCDDGIGNDERRLAYERWKQKQDKRDKYSFLTDWVYKLERKHLIIFLCIPLALFVFYIVHITISEAIHSIHTETPVNITAEGIELIPGVDAHERKVNVRVEGAIYHMRFDYDYFFGQIEIDGFTLVDSNGNEYPSDNHVKVLIDKELTTTAFLLPNIMSAGGISFTFVDDRHVEIDHVGFSSDGTGVALLGEGRFPRELAPRGLADYCIYAPAMSREYALIGAARVFPRTRDGVDAFIGRYFDNSESYAKATGQQSK